MSKCQEQLYTQKLDNLDEINQFLKKQNYHNSLNIDNLCSLITIKEIRFIILNSKKRIQAQMVSVKNSIKLLKKNYHQICTTSSRKEKRRGHFPIHFMKLVLPRYHNYRDSTKKIKSQNQQLQINIFRKYRYKNVLQSNGTQSSSVHKENYTFSPSGVHSRDAGCFNIQK